MRFRKSKKVGPFRLNFSNAGVGVSVGVKGARVGVNSRSSYIHVGRGGVYYRKTFPHPKNPPKRPNEPGVGSVPTMGNREAALQDHIESSIPAELKRQLARATAPAWEAYLVAGVSYLALSPRSIGVALIVGVSLFFILRAWSRHRRKVVLTYELDDMGKNVVGALQQILEHLAQTSRFWFIGHEEAQTDWKRNAGAAWSVRRSQAAVNQEPMPNVRTNVSVWCVAARKGPRCYFLPDAPVYSAKRELRRDSLR